MARTGRKKTQHRPKADSKIKTRFSLTDALTCHSVYLLAHLAKHAIHLEIRESYDHQSLMFQLFRALQVSGPCILAVVSSAIELDHEPCLGAVEVDDEPADRLLPLPAYGIGLQVSVPELALPWSHSASETPRPCGVRSIVVFHMTKDTGRLGGAESALRLMLCFPRPARPLIILSPSQPSADGPSCNYGRTACAVGWLACRLARCLQTALLFAFTATSRQRGPYYCLLLRPVRWGYLLGAYGYRKCVLRCG